LLASIASRSRARPTGTLFLFASACAAGFLSSSIGAHSLGAEGLEHITLTAPFGICYGVPSAWLWDLFILTLHRITESQNHRMVGLERTPRLMKLQPPPQAGPRTSTFHTSPGCPGPIQPGLEHLQGWMGHPQPLWAAVQHLITLIGKNSPLTTNLNLPSFNLKPFSLVLLLSTL